MKYISGMAGFVCLFLFAAMGAHAQNYKIRQTNSIAGRQSESTIYVKSPRKRTEGGGMMGIGADVATIEQCDLKQNVKISDKKRQYVISPFADTSAQHDTPARPTKSAPSNAGTVTKGGTLTITSSIIDTGERKQMFGLTARHVKTSMKMESSPDACSPANMHIETDGWYVDLPQFSCPVNFSAGSIPYQQPARSGCQDRISLKESGGGRIGFPLQSTTEMDSGSGQTFTQTVDTIEFSKATLDDSLFNIPAGYTVAKQEQDLYGRPDFSAMMRGNDADDTPKNTKTKMPPMSAPPPVAAPAAKRPGVIRIGVFAPTVKPEVSVPTADLRAMLIRNLTTGAVEAVPIESEADARAAECDYIVSTDFTKLKKATASKFLGVMGDVTGQDTSSSEFFEGETSFKLVALGTGKPVLQNKAAGKKAASMTLAAEGALAKEAAAVLGAAK